MSDSTRFRPTSRFVVTRALWFTIVILLVTTFAILGRAVLARPGVPAGLPDVLKWTALISPVLFLSLVGVFYGFGAIWPVIVSRDGITCWTARGSKRLVRWCDIAKVNSFSASNIPMLRIELVGSRENVTTPIYTDRVRDVAHFVAAHAPSENPLRDWLDLRTRDV